MFLRARYVFRTSIGTALLGHGMNTTSKQVGTKNVPSRQARQSGWLVQKMYQAGKRGNRGGWYKKCTMLWATNVYAFAVLRDTYLHDCITLCDSCRSDYYYFMPISCATSVALFVFLIIYILWETVVYRVVFGRHLSTHPN